jgi:hypothetical protein
VTSPACRLLLATGRETVDGATLVFTECCSMELTHAVDSSGDDVEFDLTSFFDAEGTQCHRCKCGMALPDARAWRP